MVFSDEHIKKRLKGVNPTQDSVETASLWIMHHKDSNIDQIAKCWMDLYKEGTDSLRTALIYVMNDVVQKATKRGTTNPTTVAFHPHVINAIGMSSPPVKKAISRCVEVFEQRKVFLPHIVEEMKAALVCHISTEKDRDDLADVDNLMLIRQIETFQQNETLTEKARDILSKTDFNFKATMEGRVKDRTEGQKLLQEMEGARHKLVVFMNSVEKHQNRSLKLISTLTQLKNAFNLQLKDVILVNDAYEKFANGICETKNELETLINSGTLPAADLSPPLDAPSPTANDDTFIFGIDNGEESLVENADEDMEMDEGDEPNSSATSLIPPKEYVAPIPPIPSVDPRLQKILNNTQGINRPDAPININNSTTLDPRQARFFAPPPMPHSSLSSSAPQEHKLPIQIATTSETNPPFRQGSSAEVNMPSRSSADLKNINIDTSHPPPHFFGSSQSGSSNEQKNSPLPANPMLFNPTTPPPSFFHQSTPRPSHLHPNNQIRPHMNLPVSQAQASGRLLQSGPHLAPRLARPSMRGNGPEMNDFAQKRRNSNASRSPHEHSKRGTGDWHGYRDGRNGSRGRGQWRNSYGPHR